MLWDTDKFGIYRIQFFNKKSTKHLSQSAKKNNKKTPLFTLSLPAFVISSICCDYCSAFLLSLVFFLKQFTPDRQVAKLGEQKGYIYRSVNGRNNNGSLCCENSCTEYCGKQREI